MKKTFGELVNGDKIYVITLCKFEIKIETVSVNCMNVNKYGYMDICCSSYANNVETIFDILPHKNSSSTKFSSFTHKAFSTTLEEAESIRKEICADRIKKLDETISKSKILKTKWENYYKSID